MPRKGDGKGKGKSSDAKRAGERGERVSALKQKTKCNECGQFGHWAGDAICPMKGKGAGKKPRSVYFTVFQPPDRPAHHGAEAFVVAKGAAKPAAKAMPKAKGSAGTEPKRKPTKPTMTERCPHFGNTCIVRGIRPFAAEG